MIKATSEPFTGVCACVCICVFVYMCVNMNRLPQEYLIDSIKHLCGLFSRCGTSG